MKQNNTVTLKCAERRMGEYMRIVKLTEETKNNILENLLKRSPNSYGKYEAAVGEILSNVRANKDAALFKYTKDFDKADINASNIVVTKEEIEEAYTLVDPKLVTVIRKALKNIKEYHEKQKQYSWFDSKPDGTILGQKITALSRVGVYVPGGKAAYPSSVLMNVLPAKVAGVEQIIMCTPPDKEGKVYPTTLVAANEAGVDVIYKVGGAQAIAAMAYGTESIPKVYKIFGPGNQYVTAAKQLVSLRDVAIDMPAGPSEVEVLADASANPVFVAADLLSQAEHGVDSQAMLITTSEKLQAEVVLEVEHQLARLPRKEIAEKSLENSKLILVRDLEEALELTNAYAPEHLIIETENYLEVAERITNAGSVFLGSLTPESAGDYASGTNHTLPTNGYAKAYSGVSLDSFIRKITFQEIVSDGIQAIGPAIEEMAANEHLDAHKNAVTVRLDSLK